MQNRTLPHKATFEILTCHSDHLHRKFIHFVAANFKPVSLCVICVNKVWRCITHEMIPIDLHRVCLTLKSRIMSKCINPCTQYYKYLYQRSWYEYLPLHSHLPLTFPCFCASIKSTAYVKYIQVLYFIFGLDKLLSQIQ